MQNDKSPGEPHTLQLKRLGIETGQENVIFMRSDCHVCRAEGLMTYARVLVRGPQSQIVATLNHVSTEGLLAFGEAGLSEQAWKSLGAKEGDPIQVRHLDPLTSLGKVRAKIFGHRLGSSDMTEIIDDVVSGHYSNVHLAAFITACASHGLDKFETIALTTSMIGAGKQIDWGSGVIVDKHCIGGLPGNRTTPIIVAIVSACDLVMPKTSSRAITSPAGTADVMETLAPVKLDLKAMRRVVDAEGGCIVWGGAVDLSPADDILIRVERALEVDSEGQLVASILSKKIAAGATHLVLDLPVGPTAKLRSKDDADKLENLLRETALNFGLATRIIQSDGSQPVGSGVGPALEARDVLAVLTGAKAAPQDLRQRSLALAGALLELGGAAEEGSGVQLAASTLDSGRAWSKFQAICEAQGGLREPPTADYQVDIAASISGRVTGIDNRRLSTLAKLAGAPVSLAAGVKFQVHLGQKVLTADPLMTIHAESKGELDYALDYYKSVPWIVEIEGEI